MSHSSLTSNGENNLSDQDSKPEPMTGIKTTTSIITPKIEPLPYYPGPSAPSHDHIIKEIKPAVSSLINYISFRKWKNNISRKIP